MNTVVFMYILTNGYIEHRVARDENMFIVSNR